MASMRVTKECVVYNHEPYTALSGDFEVDPEDVDMLLGTGIAVLVADEAVDAVAEVSTEDDLSFLETIQEVADTVPRKKSKKNKR